MTTTPDEPAFIVATQDEAIAEAMRQLRAEGEGGEITVHTAECHGDGDGEGCDCSPLVLVLGAEA
jgi:hypothetical protein